jgi:hypothetical protein
VEELGEEIREIKNVLPLRRRKMAAATKKAHIECIQGKYEGKCPCCRETQIVSPKGETLPACQEEHFVNRHENAMDKTWLVCAECNLKKTSGRLDHIDVEAFFRAYQAVLRKHLAEKTGARPQQVRMVDVVKLKRTGS